MASAIDTERDPARDYAVTIAEAFDAHLVGIAVAYEHPLPAVVLGQLPAELVSNAAREHRKLAEDAVERFNAAAKRLTYSALGFLQYL